MQVWFTALALRKGRECAQARKRWAPKSTDSEGGSSRTESGNPRTNGRAGKEGAKRKTLKEPTGTKADTAPPRPPLARAPHEDYAGERN